MEKFQIIYVQFSMTLFRNKIFFNFLIDKIVKMVSKYLLFKIKLYICKITYPIFVFGNLLTT